MVAGGGGGGYGGERRGTNRERARGDPGLPGFRPPDFARNPSALSAPPRVSLSPSFLLLLPGESETIGLEKPGACAVPTAYIDQPKLPTSWCGKTLELDRPSICSTRAGYKFRRCGTAWVKAPALSLLGSPVRARLPTDQGGSPGAAAAGERTTRRRGSTFGRAVSLCAIG